MNTEQIFYPRNNLTKPIFDAIDLFGDEVNRIFHGLFDAFKDSYNRVTESFVCFP